MRGPKPWKRLLESFSVRELEGLIEAKRLLRKREELQEKLAGQKRALRQTKREIRKIERAIARAVKARKRRARRTGLKAGRAGRKPGPKPGRKPGRKPAVARKGRRGLRKGRLLGLRPSSLAHRVYDYIAKSPNKQARVSAIVSGLKGWGGKTPQELLRFVGATLSKRAAYFKRVDRGLYTVAATN